MTYIPTRDSALLNDLTRNTYRAMTHAELVEALIKRDIKIEELQHEKSAAVQDECEACAITAIVCEWPKWVESPSDMREAICNAIRARNAQEERKS